MKQTIRLQDIYSADLFTRSRASELRACINENANEITLDFDGIGFMSRSFADEVCNIIDDMGEPSARCIAESPKARCEKRCEKRTRRIYVFACSRAPGVTPLPPVARRMGSRNTRQTAMNRNPMTRFSVTVLPNRCSAVL